MTTLESTPEPETWRILLVDDHEDIREGYAAFLRQTGAEVVTAGNGCEALDAVERFAPDVVVTDLNMPVMDGWQAVRVLRNDQRTSSVPVIAMTASVMDAQDAATARAAGFDMVCRKPCWPTDLLSAIRSVLRAAASKARRRLQPPVTC